MAPRHLQILMGCALVLTCVQPTSAIARIARDSAPSIDELVGKEPMIFFVAKGAPAACGPGCSEWIAADGLFDRAADQRLRDVLEAHPNKKLPIFFNSYGGNARAAMLVGMTLRKYGLFVGVARTRPEGCRNPRAVGDACRRLMQSKPEHSARLVTGGARCLSACVLAFLGGNVRQVARDAQLGVHSARVTPAKDHPPNGRLPSLDEVHDMFRQYTVAMGGDPGLVDIAAKVRSDRMHYLGRDELTRFGFNVGDTYQSPWNSYYGPVKQLLVVKSVQMREPAGSAYRNRGVRLWCGGHALGAWFDYDRDWLPREADAPDTIRVVAGESELVLTASEEQRGRERVIRKDLTGPVTTRRSGVASREFLNSAIAARDIVITEVFHADAGSESSRVVRLSTDGLAKSLTALQLECGWIAKPTTRADLRPTP